MYRDFMQGAIPMLVAPETKYICVHIRDVEQAILKTCTQHTHGAAVQKYLIGNSNNMLTMHQGVLHYDEQLL